MEHLNVSATLQLKTPLVGIETCKSVLAVSEDRVLALVDSGDLRFAFNLAAPGARARTVRVLSLSLIDLAKGSKSQPSDVQDAIKYIQPGSSVHIPAAQLARSWNVSGTHVSKLLMARQLIKVSDGPHAKASPLVDRTSSVRFLTLRRI